MTREDAGLPYWLTHPTVIVDGAVDTEDTDTASSGESVFARRVLDALGLERLFPVQTAVHSRLRSPDCGDLCVMAATGSGKTLAYAIPIVEALCKRQVRRLRALILVPTRDLVRQVDAVMAGVVKVSGTDLESGRDYLVATPGKLLDLLSGSDRDRRSTNASVPDTSALSARGNAVSLRHLNFLVIDEADRLLDQTWQDWCKVLMRRLQNDRQSVCNDSFDSLPWKGTLKKLLFSATITKNPAQLAPLQLERPLLLSVTAASFATPPTLREAFVLVRDEEYKLPVLFDLLERHVPVSVKRVLIFVRAVKSVARLSRLLAAVLPSWKTFAFHGDLSEERRLETLAGFEGSEGRSVLVASDAAARGLDLRGLTLVMSYDCPNSVAAYVHRCGRVARAGTVGYALTLVTVSEKRPFADDVLVRGLNRRICTASYNVIGANDCVLEMEAEADADADGRGEMPETVDSDSGTESDAGEDSVPLPLQSQSQSRKTVYKMVPPEDIIYEHWQPSLQEALNAL